MARTTLTKSTEYKRTLARPAPGFNSDVFLDTVVEGLGQDYMGYAFLLQSGNGERIVEAEYGLARTEGERDGRQDFTIDTKTAWGDVSKMVTFAAGMNRIEAVQNQSGDVALLPPAEKPSLAASMKAFLPLRWQQSLHPGFENVSIDMLMQNRAGFVESETCPIWERLDSGPEGVRAVGSSSYSGTSAALFYALPFFLDPERARKSEHALEHDLDEVYDVAVDWNSKLIYHKYVQEHIWKPLGVRARCNETNFSEKNYAMFYNGPSDAHGKLAKPDPNYPRCAPGGWILSVLSMGKFAHALSATSKIISPESYAKMANTAEPDRRLGWESVHVFPDGIGFSHSGALWEDRARAAMMAFPNGFTAVGVMNSKPLANSSSFKDLFLQAYGAALM